jgi:hypothetical protein
MSWLQDFKLALIKQESVALASLIDTLPQFDTLEEMDEAKHLILQAITLFETLEKSSSIEMQKIRKAKKYLDN